MLDEVLAGLNPTEVEHMIGIIRRIRERGVTILIIEHLMRAIIKFWTASSCSMTAIKLAEGFAVGRANPQVIEADPAIELAAA